MVTPEPDEALMSRVKADDREAWNVLYNRHAPRIFSFLLRRTGAKEQAEDAHQEVWLRVWRFRRTWTDGRTFRPWLWAIACNSGRDAVRPQPEILRFSGVHHDQHELRDRLVEALHHLDPLDRRVVLLSSEGFTSDEMAEITGLSSGAVRMRLCRSRASLQERLQ